MINKHVRSEDDGSPLLGPSQYIDQGCQSNGVIGTNELEPDIGSIMITWILVVKEVR